MHFSLETVKHLQEFALRDINRHRFRKYIKRHALLLPEMMRKVAWRLMVKAMTREAARFIQSRFGELKISKARYGDLLSEADDVYLKYLEAVRKLININAWASCSRQI